MAPGSRAATVCGLGQACGPSSTRRTVSYSVHICPPRLLCLGPLGPSFRRHSFLLQGLHTYYLLPLSGMFFPFHLWVHPYVLLCLSWHISASGEASPTDCLPGSLFLLVGMPCAFTNASG